MLFATPWSILAQVCPRRPSKPKAVFTPASDRPDVPAWGPHVRAGAVRHQSTGDLVVVLKPNRKPMSPEEWAKVREQVKENLRKLDEYRAKKKSANRSS